MSEEALAQFTEFFLTGCLDQVTLMEGLIQPDRLRTRILLWAGEETLEKGVLTSEGPRAPLRLAFPAPPASRWMPGLFPEKML